MSLTLAAVMTLSQQCAPGIAIEALVPQLQVESHFDPLAIDINNGPVVHARSLPEAVAIASRYIQAGYSVDLGIAQINSRNLSRLGLTIEQAFDPCRSLAAAQVVLSAFWTNAAPTRSNVDAISTTWSLYNSGSTSRGFRNGYVGKVWSAAADLVPQMRVMLASSDASAPLGAAPLPAGQGGDAPALPHAPQPLRWFYGTANSDALVFKGQ
jgi:type IV secretion system protein VirB1